MSGEGKLAPWESAIAGASGAVLANALVYPLDMYDMFSFVELMVTF